MSAHHAVKNETKQCCWVLLKLEKCTDFHSTDHYSATHSSLFANSKHRQYATILFSLKQFIDWDQYTFRGQQKVYTLKRMDSFDINLKMLKMFGNAHLESVLTFCIVCWFGGTAETQRNALSNIISTGS